MSRTGSTTNLPVKSSTSDTAAVREHSSEDKSRTVNVSEETPDSSDSVYWVDWDGPDDPMNPQKYVACSTSLFLCSNLTYNILAAGRTARNGLLPLLSLLSHS